MLPLAMKLSAALFTGLLVVPLIACGSDAKVVPPPPPLPTMPVPKAAAAEPPIAADEPAAEQPVAASKAADRKLSKKEKAKQAKQAAAASKASKASKTPEAPVVAAKPPPAAAPVASKPAAAAPAKGKVSIPRTAHVSIDVPTGLQADLDKDPRMQPWANQVVSVIDKCHAQNATAQGTIEVLITMHENARPNADIKKLPGALSPIVACATSGLMRTKMPLFTGSEGTRYTVKINFK